MLLRLVTTLVIAASPFVSAQAQDVPIYPVETFFETTNYRLAGQRATWTRDGKRLLITSDETGISNAYEINVASGEKRQLTFSRQDSIVALGWLLDDASFLYSADQGGNELDHVFLRLADGTNVDLTPGTETKANFLGWHANRRSFYLSTNERDASAFDIYRYDANDLTRELIFQNDMLLGDLQVSANGAYAAGVKENNAKDNDVYVISLGRSGGIFRGRTEGSGPRNITPHDGDVSHSVYDFRPDGSRLIIGTDQASEFQDAYSVNLRSGRTELLIQAGWDISNVTYSPSGAYRVQSINEDGRTVTSIWDVSRRRPVGLPITTPEGAMTQVRFSPNENKVAVLISSSSSPANVYVVPLSPSSQDVVQLTDALDGQIDPEHLVEAEVIRYRSFDDVEIPGILYRPHGSSELTPAPAVVLVHGGPGGQSRASYSAMVQHLVNNGYAVLAANNRGSSGYGKGFFHLDDRRHGEGDLRDIVEARTYLESLDWVDGDNIAVMGGSYGGFMVMAALSFHPEVFDAGINIFGVTNWERTLSSIPPWWGSFRERLYDEMGDPATDAARHRRISPLFHADQVTKPVLIVQGANDPRVLQIESDEMVAALEANNVPVDYILFPDEGHGFQKRTNRIAASKAYVQFLDRFLLGDTIPTDE